MTTSAVPQVDTYRDLVDGTVLQATARAQVHFASGEWRVGLPLFSRTMRVVSWDWIGLDVKTKKAAERRLLPSMAKLFRAAAERLTIEASKLTEEAFKLRAKADYIDEALRNQKQDAKR